MSALLAPAQRFETCRAAPQSEDSSRAEITRHASTAPLGKRAEGRQPTRLKDRNQHENHRRERNKRDQRCTQSHNNSVFLRFETSKWISAIGPPAAEQQRQFGYRKVQLASLEVGTIRQIGDAEIRRACPAVGGPRYPGSLRVKDLSIARCRPPRLIGSVNAAIKTSFVIAANCCPNVVPCSSFRPRARGLRRRLPSTSSRANHQLSSRRH